jgi:heme/copper-type cytochrome/quinol oxidase subunit 3
VTGMTASPTPSSQEAALAAEDEGFYHESALNATWTGSRLAVGGLAFLFGCFVFAYFYLRSLNNGGRWRPAGIDPPQIYGYVIIILFALSAGIFAYADRAARRARPWLPAAGLALALGLAGAVVQGFEWANLGFAPTKGGYASVFLGWTLLFTVFVLFALIWVEIIVATGLRQRRTAETYVPHGLDAASFYWTLLVAIGVAAWVILYLL